MIAIGVNEKVLDGIMSMRTFNYIVVNDSNFLPHCPNYFGNQSILI